MSRLIDLTPYVKIKTLEEEINTRYNRLMKKVNIGIVASLAVTAIGIGMLIYGSLQ